MGQYQIAGKKVRGLRFSGGGHWNKLPLVIKPILPAGRLKGKNQNILGQKPEKQSKMGKGRPNNAYSQVFSKTESSRAILWPWNEKTREV